MSMVNEVPTYCFDRDCCDICGDRGADGFWSCRGDGLLVCKFCATSKLPLLIADAFMNGKDVKTYREIEDIRRKVEANFYRGCLLALSIKYRKLHQVAPGSAIQQSWKSQGEIENQAKIESLTNPENELQHLQETANIEYGIKKINNFETILSVAKEGFQISFSTSGNKTQCAIFKKTKSGSNEKIFIGEHEDGDNALRAAFHLFLEWKESQK